MIGAIPTVQCVLCKAVVPKRRTAEVRKGYRACKEHPEVQAKLAGREIEEEHRAKMAGAFLSKEDQERMLEELGWTYAQASDHEREQLAATIAHHYGRFFAERVKKLVASRADPRRRKL